MTPPPTMDGARVLMFAVLPQDSSTGRTRHVVAGEVAGPFAAVVLAKYDDDPGVYLFYCDADWNVVTDTYHDNVVAARLQAAYEFGDVQFAASAAAPTAPAELEFVVEVRLLQTAAGGRMSPIADGYRCDCAIGNTVDGVPAYNGASFFTGGASIAPGGSGPAVLCPHLPAEWGHVTEGMTIPLYEGRRLIGHALIVQASGGWATQETT